MIPVRTILNAISPSGPIAGHATLFVFKDLFLPNKLSPLPEQSLIRCEIHINYVSTHVKLFLYILSQFSS
ncbi:hypothetical protein, partial [Leptospira fletcheri]|uniref:hypothetical protein n=1 Tax=Leptospira fletcheri TaxID=2484981 RepID=UPI001AEF4B6C